MCSQRPPFCPVSNLTDEQRTSLPEETLNRGVDVGAVVIVESADGKVLLIRRPKTQRTFPGVWVPPGGHVEANETVSISCLISRHSRTTKQLNQNNGWFGAESSRCSSSFCIFVPTSQLLYFASFHTVARSGSSRTGRGNWAASGQTYVQEYSNSGSVGGTYVFVPLYF